jgi:hypothetical protein
MQLPRQKLREHEMETCPKRPIEMQVASLMKKFEAIDAENKLLLQELGEIKEAHKIEMKEMKSTYEGEITQLKRKLDELNDDKAPLSLPPYYFSMRNANRYLECNMDFVSAPFYSHPGGYKMHISILSNVEHDNRSGYLNLYVSILCGEFDDHLKWPFDGEVTVQAYNRTLEKWVKEEKLCLNKEECDLHVVGRQIGILSFGGWGCLEWLSFQDMKSHFVKDTNILRLRVVSVKVNSV